MKIGNEKTLRVPKSTCTTNGWYWYCDEHDTHGNADTRKEAKHMAQCHNTYHKVLQWKMFTDQPDLENDPDYADWEPEDCEVDLYQMKPGF